MPGVFAPLMPPEIHPISAPIATGNNVGQNIAASTVKINLPEGSV